MRIIFFIVCTVIIMHATASCGCLISDYSDKTNASSSVSSKHEKQSKYILVRFKPGTGQDIIKNIQNKLGLKMIRTMSLPDLYLMEVTDETPVEAIVTELNKQSEILYAEPDYQYRVN